MLGALLSTFKIHLMSCSYVYLALNCLAGCDVLAILPIGYGKI